MPSFPVSVLGFLFVSFRPALIRSHSCSSGASLLLSPSGFSPSDPLSFVRFSSGSGYSASVASFPFTSGFASQWLPPCSASALAFTVFPRSSQPGFPCFLSRFSYSAFLFVSFHPSRLRSHSCSTGASLLFRFRFSSGLFCLLSAFFRLLQLASDYSAFCSFFSPLPVLPWQRFFRCAPVSFVPFAFLFRSACFHAVLPIPVLSFLRFLSPFFCFVTQALRSFRPPVSSSAVPLCFRFRFRLLGFGTRFFKLFPVRFCGFTRAANFYIITRVFANVNYYFL